MHWEKTREMSPPPKNYIEINVTDAAKRWKDKVKERGKGRKFFWSDCSSHTKLDPLKNWSDCTEEKDFLI